MNEGYVDGRRSKIRQLLLMRSTSNVVRGLGGKVFWSRMFILRLSPGLVYNQARVRTGA